MVVVLKPKATPARVPARFLAEGRRRVILVGIGGPSGSGKTTIARELVNSLGTPLGSICADNFYDHSRAPMEKRQTWNGKRTKWDRNLEDPGAIDTKLLVSELYRVGRCLADEAYAPDKVVLETPLDSCVNLTKRGHVRPGAPLGSDTVVLVVEGFLLFHDAEVAEACTHRLWLDLDCDIAMRRRFERDGDKETELDESFRRWYRNTVWSNYETHRATQLDNADRYEPTTLKIDAEQSSEQMLADAVEYLNAHLRCGGIRHSQKEVVLRPRKRGVDDSRERPEHEDARRQKNKTHDERHCEKRVREKRDEHHDRTRLRSDWSYKAHEKESRHEENGRRERRR